MTNPFRLPTHKSWNTVYGPKPHPELPEALFELAADCARRAIEEPPAGQSGFDRWVRITAIGQAAEMLVKATLAGVNPVLIAEKNSSTNTLWSLAGIMRQYPRAKLLPSGALKHSGGSTSASHLPRRACQSPSRCSKLARRPALGVVPDR